MTRLENVYREKVVPVLQKEFAYSSPMQICLLYTSDAADE